MCDFILLLKAKAKVSVPILPTNIQIITTTLPVKDKSAVIPVESPTVEKAETISKAIGSIPFSPSEILKIKIAKKIDEAENKKIEKALCNSSAEMVLFPISILFCPLIVFNAE